jgi:hypothetical protein
MIAAAAMTVLKLAAGLLSGSLGVLSDAAHSALDLVGVTLTFFSVQVSDKPADEDHTYGHGKFENLSAFGEAGLMAVSCAWIIWEAMQRIIRQPWCCATRCGRCWCCSCRSAWTGGGRGGCARWPSAPAQRGAGHRRVSLCFGHLVDGGRAMRAGRELDRHAALGVGWLRYADPFAAVVVSLMILRMTLHLGRETVAVLMDEVPAETRQRLVDEVGKVRRRAGRGAGAGAARGRKLFCRPHAGAAAAEYL